MCGIIFSLKPLNKDDITYTDPYLDSLEPLIRARGPDSFLTFRSRISINKEWDIELILSASVLGLRGKEIVPQPRIGERGVLAWNGQIFQGLDMGLSDNDTDKLFKELETREEDPVRILSRIEGPYAFVYYDRMQETVYYQVDPLSRRSLLIPAVDFTSSQAFTLTSVQSSRGKQHGPLMRSLNGGEGGMINLRDVRICVSGSGTSLDLSSAITSRHLRDSSIGAFTQVAPLNRAPWPSIVPGPSAQDIDVFIQTLSDSVRRRIENIPSPKSGAARVAILFSGGVDCSLLAALVHRHLPLEEPIDLLNVAFSEKSGAESLESERFDVPDRLSGRLSLEELRSACPDRSWRFVEINVSLSECQSLRETVLNLMYPSSTEMDLSLAFPLYFASRGAGFLRSSTGYEAYTTSAKVYISGLGADEQLAGYARHRGAYQREGYDGLLAELQKDLDRLPTRNLARDDRLISSHGREARYPYLDLSFISYLSNLPLWIKCDLSRDGGDKALLRAAAARCGLPQTSQRVKRAMQFGTRSAKMSGQDKPRAKRGQQTIDS